MPSRDDSGAEGASTPETAFLQGVERVAENKGTAQPSFTRTRAPFTRLREVWTRIHFERPPSHPARCQHPACGQPITERYFRRRDGLTLCSTCFERWATEGKAGEAE
ncbi:MAG: hypothetical protein ACREIS_03910 [Nitrospiraceae bacterium]